MRKTVLVGLTLSFAFLAVAEHRVRAVGHIPRTFGSRHGFGNVVFPGTGNPPPIVKHHIVPKHPSFSITSPGFAHNLGGIVTGFRPFTGAPVGRRLNRGFSNFVPVAYPVFIGGGYYAEPAPQPPANITIVNPPQPAPQVIVITADRTASVVRQYEPGSGEESNVRVYHAPTPEPVEAPQEEAAVYLIAFKDSTVYPATDFWVQDDTLHYVTLQGRHNQASLSLIDHQLTQRLNRERKVDFRLPAAP